ncbi:hypothetical protein R3P38DRAFT_3176066 [Favolaschia claudopus]|uniref:Uncharacterized protein n=1 Tax=Favolaschia claudopus TaxID=2862362 RepID=A0AAW0D7F3_9AGAR
MSSIPVAPSAAVDDAPTNGQTAVPNAAPAAAGNTGTGNANMKRALTYEVAVTSIIAGLPPVQKNRLVRGWLRRHLEQEDPERANAEEDEEVHQRAKTSYDISCQYLQTAHEEALYAALQRENHTDSDDDDSIFGAEDPKLDDIIIWDATHPEQTARASDDAGVVADEAIAKAIAADEAEDYRDGQAWAVSSLQSEDKTFFNFIPASLLAELEDDADRADDMDSVRAAAPSPIPSLEPVTSRSPSPELGIGRGEPMADVEMPASGGSASETCVGGEKPAAPASHIVQLVRINARRFVRCRCTDGKHLDLRRRQTYAFEASDGTVVIKKFRTMVVALD